MKARPRLVLAASGVTAAVCLPARGGAVVAALALSALLLEGVAGRALRRLRAPAVTVAGALLVQAWTGGRDAALTLGARVAGASFCTAWLVSTCRPDQLLDALRSLGLPASVCELLALSARALSVLGDTLRTAYEAQRVRLGWRGLLARARSFGALGGIVIVRALDRSVILSEAMRARGGGS